MRILIKAIVFSNIKISNLYLDIENVYDIKIFAPRNKLYILGDKNIIIDLESFLFIKKLILKNLGIIMR